MNVYSFVSRWNRFELLIVACSRLRDSGEKGEEKTRTKKRAGAGERQGHRPLFSPGSRARIIFAFPLCSRRPYYLRAWNRLCWSWRFDCNTASLHQVMRSIVYLSLIVAWWFAAYWCISILIIIPTIRCCSLTGPLCGWLAVVLSDRSFFYPAFYLALHRSPCFPDVYFAALTWNFIDDTVLFSWLKGVLSHISLF